MGIGSAPQYYARFESAESKKPAVEASIQHAVMGEQSTPTRPADPTPTATPEPTSIPMNTPVPTVYRVPTRYIPPPTKAPTQDSAPTTAQQLQRVAKMKGLNASSLARMWLLEDLRAYQPRQGI